MKKILGGLLFVCSFGAWAGPNFAISLTAGVPQMLGAELRFVGIPEFEIGLGFGSLPINTLVNSNVTLAPEDVDLQLPDTYRIYPSLSSALTAFTPWLRYYPWAESFYVQFAYAIWRFRANVVGDLRNETQGTTSPGAITGALDLTQPLYTLGTGWKWKMGTSFFIDFGLGISYVPRSTYTLSFSGSITDITPVVPAAEASFEAAKADISNQVANGITSLQNALVVLPSLYLAMGFAF